MLNKNVVVRNLPIFGVPDVDYDGWIIYIELDFVQGFQKYITLGVLSEKVIMNLPVLGGCPPSS